MLTKNDILKLTVQQLKSKLIELELDNAGRKATLQDRLLEYYNIVEVEEEDDNDEVEELYVDAENVRVPLNNTHSHTSTFTLRDIKESLNYFDGTGQPEIDCWINEFEENAISVNWNDLQKFIYSKQLFKGAALAFVRGQSISNWASLKKALLQEFGQKLSSIEIHRILQNRKKKPDESLLEYLYSIITVGKTINLDEHSIIEYFIDGVNDQKYRKSILYEATSILELKNKIKIYEKIRTQNSTFGTNNNVPNRNFKKCIHCPHLSNHLTAECKRSNNICFKCNRKGHKAYECRSNMQENTQQSSKPNHNNNFKPNHNNNFRPNQNSNFRQNQNSHRNETSVYNNQNNNRSTENIHAKIIKAAVRIYKKVQIGNIAFESLVDTGSDICIIPQTIFEALKNVELIKQSATIHGLGQGSLRTLGYIKTKVQIDNINVEWIFHVTTDLDAGNIAIIGSDILKIVNMEINSEKTTFTLKEKVSMETKNKNIETHIPEKKPNSENQLELNDFGNQNVSFHQEDNDENSKNLDRNETDFEAKTIFSAICQYAEHLRIEENDFSYLPSSLKTRLFSLIINYQPFKRKKCPIEMEITLTDDIPTYQHPRRISYNDQKLVEEQVKDWITAGIIHASKSQYASPIVLVKKKDNTKRLCCDYRKLNQKIMRDNFPMNIVDDVLHKLANASVYTTLDLRNGFFHVPIHPDSQKYTAFVTHNGQYEFRYVPFGISNAPAVFCRFISAIFHSLIQAGTIVVYMDDIIIPAESLEENFLKLEQVLSIAESYGLKISWKKCEFLKTKVNFLGYIVGNASIQPSDNKTKAVQNFPAPHDTKSLQRFLGLTSYFRRFIENFSSIAKPLTDLLCKDKKFIFKENEMLAFHNLKSALVNNPVLKLFKQGATTEVHTDASKYGYGACLLQKNSETGHLHPIEYMSRKTSTAEENYHSYELEVLAVIQALKKWRVFLQDIPFKIVTDCKAFTMTINKKDVPVRVSRWVMFLQDFDYTIEHRPGTKMKHVDALSRIYSLLAQGPLKEKIIEAQNSDPWTKVIKEIAYTKPHKDFFVKYDILYKDIDKQLIVIPDMLEKEIIENAHRQGHFSAAKTIEIVNNQFFIPKLQEKTKNIIKSCISCILTEAKAGKKEGLLNPIDKSDKPLQTFHIDHVGPLETTKKQYNYIFTIVDSFSKFTWLFPTKSTGSNEVVDRLEKITSVFGNPTRIISDRGSAFISNEFKDFCEENNIAHHLITTGVPRGNGQVERSHKIAIALLTKLTLENKQNWYKNIHKVQQFINNTPTRSTHISPFKILTGLEMNIKEDEKLKDLLNKEHIKILDDSRTNIRQMARDNIHKIQQENIKTFNKNRIEEKEYKIGELVAIKRTQFGSGLKIKGNFLGPYKVTRKKRLGRYLVTKIGESEGPIRTSTLAEYMKPWQAEPRTAP